MFITSCLLSLFSLFILLSSLFAGSVHSNWIQNLLRNPLPITDLGIPTSTYTPDWAFNITVHITTMEQNTDFVEHRSYQNSKRHIYALNVLKTVSTSSEMLMLSTLSMVTRWNFMVIVVFYSLTCDTKVMSLTIEFWEIYNADY